MAQFTSWLRPVHSPVFAFTNSERLRNQMNLLWGVAPFTIQFSDDPETTILRAQRLLQEQELLQKGDQVVIISDVLARDKLINAVQMRLVE
jgi:pyruvate kinase